MGRSGLTFEHFVCKWSKITAQKKVCFLLILPYKTWWKPRFPMNKRPLVEGYIANIGISLGLFEFLRFGWFFSVFQKIWVFGYSWSTLLWYRCYYSHRSRDALYPVCRIFFSFLFFKVSLYPSQLGIKFTHHWL